MSNFGYLLGSEGSESQLKPCLKSAGNHGWKLLVAINLVINVFSVFIPDGALPRAAVEFSPSISL